MSYELPNSAVIKMLGVLDPPTGRWADYTPAYYYWVYLTQLGKRGLISQADVPERPRVEDYADTTLPRTEGFDIPPKLFYDPIS